MFSYSSLACASLSLALSTASAQTLAQQTQPAAKSAAGPGHVISVNPFLPLFGYFAGEYEQRVTPVVSLALSGSHIKPDNTRYTNVDLKARLYPSETALRGFNFAASLGFARIEQSDQSDVYDCQFVSSGDPFFGGMCPSSKPFNTGSFAIEIGYQWLLGPSKITAVTVGGGAKRYLGDESKFQNTEQVLPTLRLSIGYAF